MRKFSIFAVCILVLVGTIGSIFCNEYYDAQLREMGLDPAKGTYYDRDGNQVSQDQWLSTVTQHLLEDNPGTTLQGQPSATVQPTTPAISTPSANNSKKQAAPKITVYFSDLYGHVVGSNQVTSGTNIAESQFPKAVEDVDGHIFDKWDYDGRVLYHDFIVRAEYK